MYTLPLADIQAAQARIAGYIRHTPIAPLPPLNEDLPRTLRLKLENLQVVGSFKPRGVFNTLLQLSPEARQRGVIAASGGNHGVALAYGAWRLGIPATVYLPESATDDRKARIGVWGARLVQHGSVWDEAHEEAVRHAEREGLTYVHPFDSDATLAGQGTLGLEIIADLPEVDCVLIAIGGGGLIAGAAAALKALRPGMRIIGVEPVGAPSMLESVRAQALRPLDSVNTIADTLSPRSVSSRTLDLTRQFVDDIVLVSDSAMIAAMRWLWLHMNQLVEPSGAAVIAALRTGAVDIGSFACPVAVICGGNAAAEPVFTAYEAQARAKGSL
jgi:threonine dehydratase